MRREIALFVALAVCAQTSWAWGRRGHAIVCETAAALASHTGKKAEFLATHSFDLGYYCNVPDLVWKKPATYDQEKNNHFMDLEIFERALGEKAKEAFSLDRLAFEKAHPDIKEDAGRAFWRVRELETKLANIASILEKPGGDTQKRHEEQLGWLETVGAIGHYVGDLSQPLHVTENYDGQSTNQKGVHAFYEETVVDELSRSPHPSALAEEVGRVATREWPAYAKRVAKLSSLEILLELSKSSNEAVKALLATDKKAGRSDLAKAAKAHRAQIVERLASGAMAMAEIFRRNAHFDWDEKKFYSFDGAPAFVAPPTGTVASEPKD